MKTASALLCSICLLLLIACGGSAGNAGGEGNSGGGAVTPPVTGAPIIFDISNVKTGHLGAEYAGLINLYGAVTSLTISGQLPPGIQATVGQYNGSVTFAGTPTQSGSFQFTLQAVGKPGYTISTNQNVTIAIDTALAIVELSMDVGVVGKPYQFQLHSVNGSAPYAWSYLPLIPGITIDPASGLVSGVPTYSQGNIQVTLTDSSSPPKTAIQFVMFPIVFPLTQNSNFYTALLKIPFTSSLNVSGGALPLHYSLIGGSLPPGIGLDLSSGQFFGTPTQVGSSTFTFQVQDSATPPQVAQFTDTISVIPPALSLSSDSFPNAIPQGVPLDIFLAANGGSPPYNFSLIQGSLPVGLSLNRATGEISGTPSTLGNYSFQVSVSDSSNPTMHAATNFNATVQAALGRNDVVSHATPLGNGNYQASISPYSDPVGSPNPMPDQDYYQVSSSGGSVLTIAVAPNLGGSLDPVLEIVDANGIRMSSCRPSGSQQAFQQPCLSYHVQNGGTSLDVQVPGPANNPAAVYPHVLDYRGDARPDLVYYIEVSGIVQPLQITSTEKPVVLGTYSGQPLAVTGGVQPYSWSLQSGTLPPGMALTGSGLLSGTPTAMGTYSGQFLVTDSGTTPQTATQNFSIQVYPPLQITTAALPDGRVGVPYHTVLTSQGGYPPIYWGGNCGQQYPELYIDSANGILLGTPKSAGQTSCYLYAFDSSAGPAQANQFLHLTIQP